MKHNDELNGAASAAPTQEGQKVSRDFAGGEPETASGTKGPGGSGGDNEDTDQDQQDGEDEG